MFTSAAFTPDTCSPDTSCIHLYPFVSPVASRMSLIRLYTLPIASLVVNDVNDPDEECQDGETNRQHY